MQPPAARQGRRGPRAPAGKGAPGAGERARRAPAGQPPKPGWALTTERLAAMSPAQRPRRLLFGDLLEDAGAAAPIFPRESVELEFRVPDPRVWTQSPELPAERRDGLLGVLKAAEARGRVRALRLRYGRLRVKPERGGKGRAGQRPGRGDGSWYPRERGGGPAGARRWVGGLAGLPDLPACDG